MRNWFKKYEYKIGVGEYERMNWRTDELYFDKKMYKEDVFFVYYLLCMMILFVILFFIIPFGSWDTWVLRGEFIICIIAVLVNLTHEKFQKVHDFHKRVKRVPEHIRDNAKQLYGNDWRESAVECYETHVGGDCPLCGAT